MEFSNNNVVLLVVDSLRFDHVGPRGEQVTLTPAIDEWFGEQGITFSNFFANSTNTPPCMTAMLTSTYPLEYGGFDYIVDERTSIAEHLSAEGYDTAAIHSNPYLSSRSNFDKGFDHYNDNLLPGFVDSLSFLSDSNLNRLNKLVRIIRQLPYLPADSVNSKAEDWIEMRGDQFFLWLQYMDAHGPYLDRSDQVRRYDKLKSETLWQKAVKNPEKITEQEAETLRRSYREEVKYVDRAIGEFMEWLSETGRLEDTVVVLTADHGEQFREHGHFSHGDKPYDELVRVPFFIRLPDETNGERMVRGSHVDVLPTLLNLLGIDRAKTDEIRGRNILNDTDHRDENRPVYMQQRVRSAGIDFYGVRAENWKYILNTQREREELYDLESDPNEQSDVSRENRDRLTELRTLVEQHIERVEETNAGVNTTRTERDEEVETRLRKLGYLD